MASLKYINIASLGQHTPRQPYYYTFFNLSVLFSESDGSNSDTKLNIIVFFSAHEPNKFLFII